MPTELTPCSKCGAGRPPELEMVVYAHTDLIPLIIQAITDGGMCVECAKRHVDAKVVRGLVHESPKEDDWRSRWGHE
jgi:hypothetical protein